MRKNILSLSIAAMIGGLGLAGGAIAASTGTPGTAGQLEVTPEGIGHILVVPYYTAQSGNITTLSIVNTDEVNGKAVKVRFRGASNSDDVYDFTLFLSPGDVWAAKVGKNASTGLAELSTEDDSCTLPTNVGTNPVPRAFITTRVNPKSDMANETREGYIEILNMADVPPGTAVYTATKHVNGVLPAPCALGAVLPAASPLRPLLTQAGINSAGFSNPTSGLFANWSIIDLNDGAAWSGAATAIVATTNATTPTAASGTIVMFPQNNGTPATGTTAIAALTADPLLISGAVPIQYFDLPDLSTPYTTGASTGAQQAAKLSGSLAKTSIKNEYVTDDRINAQNDWVFSLPTRRYSVALNYTSGAREYTVLAPEYFNSTNTTVEGTPATSKICVTDVTRVVWDRSEQKLENDDDFVISPSDPLKKVNLCGEVAVWSINAANEFAPSSLHAAVARKNIDVTYANGWAKFLTPGLPNGAPAVSPVVGNSGLPILGASFVKISNGLAGLGNYGVAWDHRYTRPVGAVGANNVTP